MPFHSMRTENRTRTISTPLTAISTGLLFLDLFGQTENANLGEGGNCLEWEQGGQGLKLEGSRTDGYFGWPTFELLTC